MYFKFKEHFSIKQILTTIVYLDKKYFFRKQLLLEILEKD